MTTDKILEIVATKAGVSKIGILGERDFISLLPSGGEIVKKYMDGSKLLKLSAQLQCKGKNQPKIISALETAAKAAINADYSDYPDIIRVSCAALPAPVLADEHGNYIYNSEIIIDYFIGGSRL